MNDPASRDSPLISVVVPTFERPEELRLCLDGFASQTAPRSLFEVVVVDDGSAADIASVAAAYARDLDVVYERREHAGIAAARNAGIDRARAPLLILYDDDLKPAPDLVAYCLDFHRRHPAEADTALLYFGPAPSIVNAPAARWAFDRLYTFPPAAGCYDWRLFWGGAVTCKTRLFRHGIYNPAYLSVEDAELAVRLSYVLRLRVHFEPRLVGGMVRHIQFPQVFRRQYSMGYFRYRLAQDHPGVVTFPYAPYDHPENHVIGDPDRLRALLASARGLELTLTPGDLDSDSGRFRLLCALWTEAELHAGASGWLHARDGRAPSPPDALSRRSLVPEPDRR